MTLDEKDRATAIRDYLAEADKCADLAAHASKEDQPLWLELADRFRELAGLLKAGR